LYVNNYIDSFPIIQYYEQNKEFKFISYTPSRKKSALIDNHKIYQNTHHVIGQEFDNVFISMDRSFRYSEQGRLQGEEHPNPDYIFYQLWYQGVSRAREKLCILVIDNEELFEKLIEVKRKRK